MVEKIRQVAQLAIYLKPFSEQQRFVQLQEMIGGLKDERASTSCASKTYINKTHEIQLYTMAVHIYDLIYT